MSLDILSNLSKEAVSKNSTTSGSKVEVSVKKEGSSLFDSLMKDIQKDTQSISTEKSQLNNETTKSKIKSENKHLQTKEGTVEASKKVSEGLVDLVVDGVKNKSKKEISLLKESDKTNQKESVSKSNEEIKSKVEIKVTTIKEAVADIKNEISKIGQEDLKSVKKNTDDKKESDKTNQKESVSKSSEEIKSKVEIKVTTIKEAVDDIKNEISQLDNGKSSDNNLKDSPSQNLKEISQNTINNQILVNETNLKNNNEVDGKTTLLANGFLNSQQKNKETVSLTQLNGAKNNIEQNKTLKSVKDSANMLDLNLQKVDVQHSDQKGEIKSDLLDKKSKESQLLMMQNRGLNRFIIDKENISIDNKNIIANEQIETVREDRTLQKEKNILLNVPQNVVETIQSKIIGAQQKVGSFMSEVARNMYLNYKPPFTSFRMNLNPANLGSIAVVMRASKTDNAINVSMNMNNSSTMDIFADNKTALQTALQKQLGEGSNVTLNFDMQDSGTSEQFGQFNQNNNSNTRDNTSNTSEESTNIIIEEENTEEHDYM